MLRIGLTGGIAAGKSVVSGRLADLGAVVVDADVLARAVVEPGSEGLDEVVGAFGRDVLGADGALDRAALGRLVFTDSSARERLNAIIHPRVRAGAAHLIGQAPEGSVVVEDIPLLVETGQAPRFQLVVVVDAPDALRIERMVGRRGMQRGDAEQRIAAQSSREERLRAADAVLVNDRGLDELLAATDDLWRERIVPFRDNLVQGRPGPGSASARRSLSGTSGLARRVRARLGSVLPPGSSIDPAGSANGQGADDDVVHAAVRVTVSRAEDIPGASDVVTEAGFPPADHAGGHPPPGGTVHHRGADPAVDVTVVVAAEHPRV